MLNKRNIILFSIPCILHIKNVIILHITQERRVFEMFKRNELRAELARLEMTESDFAEAIGMKYTTLMSKYGRNGDFSREELVRIGKVIGMRRMIEIFFADGLA